MSAVNLTLDQFFILNAFNRVMATIAFECEALRAIRKNDAAEKLEANLRHVEKIRGDFMRDAGSQLVVAQAGVIQQLDESRKQST